MFLSTIVLYKCTCFSAQFSIPSSFLHMFKSRTSKKQYSVLDDFNGDYIRSENGNYFIDIFSDAHPPYFQELRGDAEWCPGWMQKINKTVIYLLKAVTLKLFDFRTPLRSSKLLRISKIFCLSELHLLSISYIYIY